MNTRLNMRMSRYLLLGLIIFMISAHVAVAGSHPNMYLNQSEIDAINVKVTAGVEPWASAYSRVKSAADTAMQQVKLESVTYQGPVKSSRHSYFTEPPYCGWSEAPFCRDGQISGNADRGDYEAAIRLGNVVRDLGLAYAFTGEAKYAEKVIDFIRTWSLDADTRMTPIPGNRIETYITFPGYFYGADLIWNYEGWDPEEKTAFQAWVKRMGDYVFRNGEGNNNFSNWRVVMLASAGALLDDDSYLARAQSEWIRLLPIQISGAGSSKAGVLGQEAGRTRGLHYSMYALNAMIQGAEILRHRNINLYDYKDAAGRGLELVLDFITPYAINPALWGNDSQTRNYEQITPITQKDSMALYELAYSHYQKDSYLDAINRWNRPMDETRVMGITTLTHANRFDLTLAPTAPGIVTQPESVTVTEGEDASFSITVTGSGPLNYQWFRDGSAITGAASASYTVTDVSSSDNGRVYSSQVSNNLGTVISDGATLDVLFDVIAPTLLSTFAVSDSRVDIVFSERVDSDSAQNIGNYQIDSGIVVTSANLGADGRTVSLIVSQLTADTAYTVLVSNVRDLAQGPNTIVAQSSENFTYRTANSFDGVNGAEGWTPLTASRWSVVMDESDMAYYLNTTDFSNLPVGRLGEYSLLSANFGDFTFTAQARLGDDVANSTHADYVVVFGFQDENNYYFAMFNNDQNSTQLFRVVEGNRKALTTAVDTDWLTDNAYHSIAITRKGNSISVSFDGNLIMSATDDTFGAGKVGVGSYNDSAYFDDIRVVSDSGSDTVAPVINLNGNNPHIITVGEAYIESGATATDVVDGMTNLEASDIDASAVDTGKTGIYSVTYNTSDAEGNRAITVIRTVEVRAATGSDDTVAPVISLNGNNPHIITVGEAYIESGATATDIVDGMTNLEASDIDASAVDTGKTGIYSVTYNASDAEGNRAITVIRTVEVRAETDNDSADSTNGDGDSSDDSTNGGSGSYGPLGLLVLCILLFSSRRRNKADLFQG